MSSNVPWVRVHHAHLIHTLIILGMMMVIGFLFFQSWLRRTQTKEQARFSQCQAGTRIDCDASAAWIFFGWSLDDTAPSSTTNRVAPTPSI